ncbi:DUF1707 domain-containing protein [Streptomyces sp. NPDC020965]|uniref:DUF1707 domain-containing protein n=1 Tax=Streptomyces sp. NPDC020965 TaxID=3365105 RepID=UPI003796332C
MTPELPEPGSRSDTRASDEEREAVVERLKGAAVDGRISFTELDSRLERALGALTRGDLARVTADLPPVAAPDPGQPLVVKGGYTGATRAGRWKVPSRVTAHGGVAGVLLDFTETDCNRPEIDIEAHGETSGVTIVIPDSWAAETDDLEAEFGGLRDETTPDRLPGTPLIRLSGTGGLAGVVIRHPNRRERRRLARDSS